MPSSWMATSLDALFNPLALLRLSGMAYALKEGGSSKVDPADRVQSCFS